MRYQRAFSVPASSEGISTKHRVFAQPPVHKNNPIFDTQGVLETQTKEENWALQGPNIPSCPYLSNWRPEY
jgi:hypothetical protein